MLYTISIHAGRLSFLSSLLYCSFISLKDSFDYLGLELTILETMLSLHKDFVWAG